MRFLVTCSFLTFTAASTPAVSIGDAIIQATTNGKVDSFLGIQYATVGERFSRSTLIEPTDNGISWGPNCHQVYTGLPTFLHEARNESEECLYLNIWRPAEVEENLPVMVWIHGGGFAVGSGADSIHPGTHLAANHNVLVVTFNHRLGVLGFLPQDERGTGGMNGVYDQIVALRWIRKHISAFGGDPDRVTIFGESSGAESACMLGVSPLTRGLFRRVILQSGECINNNWVHGIPNDDPVYTDNMVQQLLNFTGASSIAELRDRDAATLTSSTVMAGWPFVALDRDILPQHPRELYSNPKNFVAFEFIVGANTYEDVAFMTMGPGEYEAMADNIEAVIQSSMSNQYDSEQVNRILQQYNPDTVYDGDHVAALAQFNGDYAIQCPIRAMASMLESAGAKVYLYQFAHLASTDLAWKFGMGEYLTDDWASHRAEMPFVFDTLDFWSEDFNPLDQTLATEMGQRWSSFARNGSPNAEGLPKWDILSENSNTLVFADGTSAMENLLLKDEQCESFDFLDEIPTTQAPSSEEESGSADQSSFFFMTFLALVVSFF